MTRSVVRECTAEFLPELKEEDMNLEELSAVIAATKEAIADIEYCINELRSNPRPRFRAPPKIFYAPKCGAAS